MKRNINKLIDSYDRKFKGNDKIYKNDIDQLHDISNSNHYYEIVNALKAGIMIGYKLKK